MPPKKKPKPRVKKTRQKQKQKQTQRQVVNVNIGTPRQRRKPRKRKPRATTRPNTGIELEQFIRPDAMLPTRTIYPVSLPTSNMAVSNPVRQNVPTTTQSVQTMGMPFAEGYVLPQPASVHQGVQKMKMKTRISQPASIPISQPASIPQPPSVKDGLTTPLVPPLRGIGYAGNVVPVENDAAQNAADLKALQMMFSENQENITHLDSRNPADLGIPIDSGIPIDVGTPIDDLGTPIANFDSDTYPNQPENNTNQMKTTLRQRGLKTSGTKADLKQRIDTIPNQPFALKTSGTKADLNDETWWREPNALRRVRVRERLKTSGTKAEPLRRSTRFTRKPDYLKPTDRPETPLQATARSAKKFLASVDKTLAFVQDANERLASEESESGKAAEESAGGGGIGRKLFV